MHISENSLHNFKKNSVAVTIQSDLAARDDKDVLLQLCHHQDAFNFSILAETLPAVADMLATDKA